jgi:hypothetical protein
MVLQQPTPVAESENAPVLMFTLGAAKLLLLSRFKRFGLFLSEIDADLHCLGG